MNFLIRRSLSNSQRLSYETVTLEQQGQLSILSFNRPKVYNAMNPLMYEEIKDVLLKEAQNRTSSILAIIGNGKFYSSGNDLKSMMSGVGATPTNVLAERAFNNHINFVDAFIDFPKPLVGMVNGPAIGIGCTHLGLCDLVLSSDSAYFYCPFTNLGQSAEACSSYTFEKKMGKMQSNAMIMFNKKFSAQKVSLVYCIVYL